MYKTLVFFALTLVPWHSVAWGAIEDIGCVAHGPRGVACGIKGTWRWTFANHAETGTDCDGQRWKLLPTSTRIDNNSKTLTISVQHLVRCEAQQEEVQPNPANPIVIDCGGFSRDGGPRKRTGIRQLFHPNREYHGDTYGWTVQLPAGNDPGLITVTATHTGLKLPTYEWRNEDHPVTLSVFASYDSDSDKVVVQNKRVGARKTETGQLPLSDPPQPGLMPQTPQDVKYRAEFNPATETMLAFIVTGEDGNLGKGNMGELNDLLLEELGAPEYRVPMIADLNRAEPLYIAVDLTQWLAFATSYSMGQEIAIVNGRSDELPGFLVSTSPATIDPGVGFVTSDPFSGTVAVYSEAGAGPSSPVADVPSAPDWVVVGMAMVLLGAGALFVVRVGRSWDRA